MFTTADRLEQSDTARAILPTLEAEVAAAERAVEYYRTLDRNAGGQSYITGGYVLTDGEGHFITRGDNGQQMVLKLGWDGLARVSRYVTQKDADAHAKRFAGWFPDQPKVHWAGHRDVVEQHLIKMKQRLAQAQATARQDPWFDGSGAAQDFDANGGL